MLLCASEPKGNKNLGRYVEKDGGGEAAGSCFLWLNIVSVRVIFIKAGEDMQIQYKNQTLSVMNLSI